MDCRVKRAMTKTYHVTHFLRTDADLQDGLAQLIHADPHLKPVADKAGAVALRRREAGFACNVATATPAPGRGAHA